VDRPDLQVVEVVVGDIYADAEVEAGVSPVHDLEVSELHEVGVLGIAHSDNWREKEMRQRNPKEDKYQPAWTSSMSFCFSSSSKFIYLF